MAKVQITNRDLSKLAMDLLNDPKIVNHIENLGEKVVSEVESSSENAEKFKWSSHTFKDGDRTSVRVGSDTNGSARYEYFSGTLFNSINRQRG